MRKSSHCDFEDCWTRCGTRCWWSCKGWHSTYPARIYCSTLPWADPFPNFLCMVFLKGKFRLIKKNVQCLVQKKHHGHLRNQSRISALSSRGELAIYSRHSWAFFALFRSSAVTMNKRSRRASSCSAALAWSAWSRENSLMSSQSSNQPLIYMQCLNRLNQAINRQSLTVYPDHSTFRPFPENWPWSRSSRGNQRALQPT